MLIVKNTLLTDTPVDNFDIVITWCVTPCFTDLWVLYDRDDRLVESGKKISIQLILERCESW